VILFEPLARRHDCTRFRSGNSMLDSYLKREALQRQQQGEACVFVLIDTEEDATRPLGYIALSATAYHIPRESGEESFQYLALLAFLARDEASREQGIGKLLVIEALRQCIAASEHIGLPGIFLETTEEGKRLYEGAGFLWLDRDAGFMYMPMEQARAFVEFTG
jgi:GNAT superfamily N-acetyltransferase